MLTEQRGLLFVMTEQTEKLLRKLTFAAWSTKQRITAAVAYGYKLMTWIARWHLVVM